jgi:hypothetical protein
MKNISELLQDADPLRHEPAWTLGQRNFRRQAVLAATSGARASAEVGWRRRIAICAAAALMVIVASSIGALISSLFTSNLQAAIRFEVRLAEERPAPGLHAAKVSGSGRLVYLYNEAIVSNQDITAARVVPGDGPSQYGVSIEFNAAGAEKMRATTGKHIGRPVAIILDGQVVLAPVLRSRIGAAAMLSGNYSRAQAERIVKGIAIR